jgi:pimeloyl-[acyl-carrier protein] methyl ester esterase
MAFIEHGDGRRTYYEHHRGKKTAVILVHGWGMSGECWNSAVEALTAEGHGVVVVDHRGCGRSDRDFDDMSIDAIAGDVVAIIEKEALRRVILNGWSLGGAVAVEAASRLGGKVAGLVLTCAASPRYVRGEGFPHGGTAEDVRAIAGAITADRAGFFRNLAHSAVAEVTGEATVAWIERSFLSSGPRAAETLLGLATLDQRETLAGFDFPVLVIGGAQDQVADPAIAPYAANCAKDADLVTFEACGHSPHLEDPPGYNEAMLRFVRKIA